MIEATQTVPQALKEINITPFDKVKFWAKVNKNGPTQAHMDTPCWIWTAGKGRGGYGTIRMGKLMVLAHRASWIIINGPIHHDGTARGVCVCHRCDKRDCVNPDHLFLGTDADNLRDMTIKGRRARGDTHGSRTKPERLARGDRNGSRLHPERRPRGDKNGSRLHPENLMRGEAVAISKLTTEKVTNIRASFARGGVTRKQLAAQYGVSDVLIGGVIARKIWKHIP